MPMQTLSGLLDTALLRVTAVIGDMVGTATHAGDNTFMPYFEATIRSCMLFLQLTNEDEEIELRDIAKDVTGIFADGGTVICSGRIPRIR